MPETLPSPVGCATTCNTIAPSGGPPGPVGPAGAAGADGADGISPFTTSTLGTEEMPPEGDTVDVTVAATDTSWVAVGEPLFVEFWGVMEVTAVAGSVITLQNLEDTTTGEYANNAAPGTVLPVGAKITPTGWQGPIGANLDPGDFFQVVNNLSEGNAAIMRGNLGLGSIATYPYGSVAGAVPNIHTTLAAGQSVWFTGVGLETKTAVQARAGLGLGAASLYQAGTINGVLIPVDQVGGLVNGQVLFATGSGARSVDAATARGLLGISSSSSNPPMLLYQHVSAGNGGAFNAGSAQTVPLNTEIVDSDNIGSLAAFQATLPAGTYRFRFVVVGNGVDVFVGYLYSVTGGTVVNNAGTGLPTYGTNGYSENGPTPTNSYSHGAGRFTLAASTVIALRAECQSTNGTTGFGLAGGFTPSGNYYYSWLELIKEL